MNGKGNLLGSSAAGIEDAVYIYTKDPLELFVSQLKCGLDNGDASILKHK